MNYLDGIFKRADIQQIREFLLHGVEEEIDPRSYIERVENSENQWTAKLRERYSDQTEYEEICNLIFEYGNAIQDVYMEIGLQVGAILAAQVCQNVKSSILNF